jgi:hypothetical protein
MYTKFYFTIVFFYSLAGFAQDVGYKIPVDSLFREDQFYASISYVLMNNKPDGYSQHSFSSSVSLGFLRDFPISKNRHWAVAFGAGYNYNDIKYNLKIAPNIPVNTYALDNSYDKSKLIMHSVEFPLEIRWRNASYESHKFWRIYSGFKVNYIFSDKSNFVSPTESYVIKNNTDINKLQYGPYISVGYNTINLYAYYGLNSIFNDVELSNQSLDLSLLNVGFVFYIL